MELGQWGWVQQNLSNGTFPKIYEFTNESIEDALIRTISYDKGSDERRFDTQSWAKIQEAIQLFTTLGFRVAPNSYHLLDYATIFTSKPASGKGKKTYHLVNNMMVLGNAGGNKNAFLMQTKRGILGTVNPVAIPGDIIIIPLGGEVPIVLRPHDDKFTFVGECYCHGFMDGEAFVKARKKTDSIYNGEDRSWLERLHEEPTPFSTQEFVLI